jgi:hypothetical protein
MVDQDKKNISMKDEAYWGTSENEVESMQIKSDMVTKSLNSDQIKLMREIIDWVANERISDHCYNDIS